MPSTSYNLPDSSPPPFPSPPPPKNTLKVRVNLFLCKVMETSDGTDVQIHSLWTLASTVSGLSGQLRASPVLPDPPPVYTE
jgi:hypothetical protein